MLIFFICFIFSSDASSVLLEQIGDSCDKSPEFKITNFTVTPWPISVFTTYNVFIGGEFLEKEYVQQIYIGTRLNRGSWNYIQQDVNKEYDKNSLSNFTITMQSFSSKGGYTQQYIFHRSDYSTIACWQIDFIA